MPVMGDDRVYDRYDPKELGAPLLNSPVHRHPTSVSSNLPAYFKEIPTESQWPSILTCKHQVKLPD